MAGKRNRASSLYHWSLLALRALSHAIMATSFVSVAIIFSLRLSPSPWGWAFISFSLFSLLSAFTGYLFFSLSLNRPSNATPPPCFALYSFLSTMSICIAGSSFILLLSNPSAVLNHLRSSRSDYDARILLNIDAAFLIATFCLQILVLLSSCVLSHSNPTTKGYHDLEGMKVSSGRVQELNEREEEEKKEKEDHPSTVTAKVVEVVSNGAKDDSDTATTAAPASSTIAKEEEKRKEEDKS